MSKSLKLSAKLLVVYGLALFSVSLMHSLAVSAYQGTGYFTGNTFCSTLFDGTLKCGTNYISVSDNNVIYPAPSIPTDKAGFIQWLTGVSSTDAGKFIIATMIGDSSKGSDLAGAIARINNPDLNLSVISASPNAYGGTSLHGRRDDGSGDRDYFYLSNYDPGARNLLVFKTGDNTIHYVLELGCANPVGHLSLPIPSSWSISAQSTVSVKNDIPSPDTIHVSNGTVNVLPGNVIKWEHQLTNDGPDSLPSVGSVRSRVAVGTGSNSPSIPNATPPSYSFGSNSGGVWGDSDSTAPGVIRDKNHMLDPVGSYTVKESDRGKTFCEQVVFDHTSSSNAADGYGNRVCVTVGADTVTHDCNYYNNCPVPPASPNECRPIKIALNAPWPKTYAPVDYPGHYGPPQHADNGLVTVAINTSLQNYGPFSTSPQSIDATNPHTTGDRYTVTYTETASHVVGFHEVTHTESSGGGGNPPSPVITWTVYDYTVTEYQAPATWTSSFGPCYDYKLTANNINLNKLKLENGESFTVTAPTVKNSSYTDTFEGRSRFPTPLPSFFDFYHTNSKSKNTNWYVTKIIVKPITGPPTDTISRVDDSVDSLLNPCDYFTPLVGLANVGSCDANYYTGSTVFPAGLVTSADSPNHRTFKIPETDSVPVGSRICFAFSVHSSQSDPSNNSFSLDPGYNHAPFNLDNNCVLVVRKPKVQVWGGDLWTKGSVSTSTSVKSGHMFGSWDEYGILASYSVFGMASGSAFANTLGYSGGACGYNTLTFTNAACSNLGHYTSAHTTPDIKANFPGGVETGGSVEVKNLPIQPNVVYVGTHEGDLTLSNASGYALEPGKSAVLKATGTVTITGNQTNSNITYTDISKLPQLVIIADKIVIKSEVTNVDAWLVANTVQTCEDDEDGENPTINKCTKQLTVNGPVIADHLNLLRTAGSCSSNSNANINVKGCSNQNGVIFNSSTPAEIFNLRADVYLWAAAHATTIDRAQTVYSINLPPRF